MLDHPTNGAVCAACWSACPVFSPPVCTRCGVSLPSWRVHSRQLGTCPACRRAPSRVAVARAIGPHEGVLREIVHALKYRGLASLSAPLSARMRTVGTDVLGGADAVVPVPLHPGREWRRGFNQAEALAVGLGPPVRRLLCRVRPTRTQAALRASERRRNVGQAFAAARFPGARGLAGWVNLVAPIGGRRARREIEDQVLVLIDDVATTGATLDACARALARCGAREVRALTAARAVLARR
jgi:predicted amidophosphoribosyltransferase